MMEKILINEIFYSLQGEGAQVGLPMIFIRLSGCTAAYQCKQMGVKCDTEKRYNFSMDRKTLLNHVKTKYPNCRQILWTGGEPLDQLNHFWTDFFRSKGYRQSLETSGIIPIFKGFDYITISPKINEGRLYEVHVKSALIDNQYHCNELRYCITKPIFEITPALKAKHYFLSPMFHKTLRKNEIMSKDVISFCVNYCLQNPRWRLSVQQHKIINIK